MRNPTTFLAQLFGAMLGPWIITTGGDVSVQKTLVASHRHKNLFVDIAKQMSGRGACDQDAAKCQIRSQKLRRNIEMRGKKETI